MREIIAKSAEPGTNANSGNAPIGMPRPGLLTGIGLLSFLACYLRNFMLPNVPIMMWSDQMLYATNGARVIAGQMPYRDYFEFLTPGTDLTYALLFKYLGEKLWIPNLLMDVLAAGAVLLITLAACRILRGASVVLPAMIALGPGLYGGLDATHHWFSTVAALGAMVVLLHGTTARQLVVSGALCGVTASFTQSKGAAVTLGFLIYLVMSHPSDESESVSSRWIKPLVLFGATVSSFLLINFHYMVALGIREWCHWIVVFPFRYYPTMPGQTWRSPLLDFQRHAGLLKLGCMFFLYVGVPAIYLGFFGLIKTRRNIEPNQAWDRLLLVAITGTAMFLAVLPSLSIMRASAVCFPATILLAWMVDRLRDRLIWAKRALVGLSMACAAYLAVTTQRSHWNDLTLPAGRCAILEPAKYELYRWMKDHTHPGQSYMGIAPLSFPLGLTCPAPIQSPGPWEYYRPEHIARSIAVLEAYRVPLLVLRPYTQFENTEGYEREHIRPFLEYVQQHYRKTKTFATGDEVWERSAD